MPLPGLALGKRRGLDGTGRRGSWPSRPAAAAVQTDAPPAAPPPRQRVLRPAGGTWKPLPRGTRLSLPRGRHWRPAATRYLVRALPALPSRHWLPAGGLRLQVRVPRLASRTPSRETKRKKWSGREQIRFAGGGGGRRRGVFTKFRAGAGCGGRRSPLDEPAAAATAAARRWRRRWRRQRLVAAAGRGGARPGGREARSSGASGREGVRGPPALPRSAARASVHRQPS